MEELRKATLEETLDPGDWTDVQALSHRIVDDATGDLRVVRDRPVWQEMPAKALKALNTEIMLRLQEQGIAALSDTTVHGEHCLRIAINNHRTRREDLDLPIRETLRMGEEIVGIGVAV